VILLSILLLTGCGGDGDPTHPPAGTSIGPDGGTVSADAGRVTLAFPAGAVDDEIDVGVEPASSPPADAGMILARAYDLSPDGAQFQQPVTLTIRYEDDQVPVGVVEEDLRLCKAVGAAWQTVPGSVVDTGANTVSAELTGFSMYGPGSPGGSGEAQITLAPSEITMPVFGTLTFDVTIEGLEDETVTWSVVEGITGGQVRGYGIYNAPAGGGVFHVRATSVENPSVFGEAEVTVATNWGCPEEPPEPAYELVWIVEVPSIFQELIYGIAWHENQLWVAGMGCIMHWTDTGQYLGWSGLGAKPDPDGPGIVHTYVGYHTGADENDSPHPWLLDGAFSWGLAGVACDAVGNVYVCDYDYSRVQKMSPGGTLMDIWEVDDPLSVAVSPEHSIYVVDHVPAGIDNLLRYTQAGVHVDTINSFGEGCDLTYFHLMGFDQGGEIFLSSRFDGRAVARLDPEHEYLGSSVRYGDGMCEARGAMTVDAEGDIYTVSSTHPFLFKKFDRDGWLLAAWPTSGPGYEDPRGIGGMTVDGYGNVYATDWTNGMILKFQPADQ